MTDLKKSDTSGSNSTPKSAWLKSEIREKALRFALEQGRTNETGEITTARAKVFEKYLLGEDI